MSKHLNNLEILRFCVTMTGKAIVNPCGLSIK